MINNATLKRFISDMNNAVAAQVDLQPSGDLLNLLVKEEDIGVWRLHDEEYDYTINVNELKQLTRLKGVPHGYCFSTDSSETVGAIVENIRLFIPNRKR